MFIIYFQLTVVFALLHCSSDRRFNCRFKIVKSVLLCYIKSMLIYKLPFEMTAFTQGRIHGLKVGTNHGEREERGVQNVRCWKGCPLSIGGGGWGGNYSPSPEFILICELKMASCGAFWMLILLQLNCLAYTNKPASLDVGLQNLLFYHCLSISGVGGV